MKTTSVIGNFWGKEWSHSIFLVVLLAVIFLSPIFSSGNTGTKALVDSLVILLLISGIFACHTTRLVTTANLVLVSLDILIRLIRMSGEYNRTTHALGLGLNTLCIMLFIRIIFFQVFREGDITAQRIIGAVSAYLLLGLIWTNFYEILYIFDPLAINFSAAATSGTLDPDLSLIRRQLVYFSFTNLTTTGFGDIVPRSDIARVFSIAESLVGQLFPTILIGRLVSLLVVKRPPSR